MGFPSCNGVPFLASAGPRALGVARRSSLALFALCAFHCALETRAADDAAATTTHVDWNQFNGHLLDDQGGAYTLDGSSPQILVLAFLGLDCPLSKLYSQRLNELYRHYRDRSVNFVGIAANASDTPDKIHAWSTAHDYAFPLCHDPSALLASACGVTVNPTVVVLDRRGDIRYRGRVDDQYEPGLNRVAPSREDLRRAIEDVLSGRAVEVSHTEAVGCFIHRAVPTKADGQWTYESHVKEIIQQRCIDCHRPGHKAPFSLVGYEEVVRWSDTIRLVLEEGRMPPWYADPAHGSFANRAAMRDKERRILIAWLDDGLPRGKEMADSQQRPPSARDDWSIQPDLVVSMPRAFSVPATGIIDYQYFVVDLAFEHDLWVQEAEIRPGNPQVVHHAGVFLVPPDREELDVAGELGSVCLVMDSIPQLKLPEGRAKRIPAGSRLLFLMHYTAVGTEQTDRSHVGLVLADPSEVRQEVATHVMVATDLEIPPHAKDYRREMVCRFDEPVEILSLFPHMHYRGKSFRYEAEYPDGKRETLLSLPTWDFNWQHNYILSKPLHLPAGTQLRAIAHYDNSANNPANPDPTATVRTGSQSWDEMFNAYYDFVLAEQDLTRQSPRWLTPILRRVDVFFSPLTTVILATSLFGLFLVARWKQGVEQR